MLKVAKINNKFIVSGFKDQTQKNNLIKKGFNNKVFKVFDSMKDAQNFIKGK